MKKIIISFIAVVMAVCSFVGCSKNDVKKSDYYMISDFENREEVVLNLYDNFFGKFDFCEDNKYVKSGKKSLKIMPSGDSALTSEDPIMKIYPSICGDKINNFSNIERIQLDAFNDTDSVVNFFMSVNFEGSGATSLKSKEKEIKLQSKKWQKCIYDFDASNLSLIYDITKVESITLRFNQIKKGEKAPVIYLDKLVAKKSSNEFVEPNVTLEQGELCSFDKAYQEYVVFSHGYGAVSKVTATCGINVDNLFSKSGKSLKVDMPRGFTSEGSWPLIELSPKLIKKSGFTEKNNDTRLVFDVYNNNEKSLVFFIEFWAENGNGVRADKVVAKLSEPNKWTTVSIPFSEINLTADITKELKFFRICWAEFNDKDTQTFYFDSFRFE